MWIFEGALVAEKEIRRVKFSMQQDCNVETSARAENLARLCNFLLPLFTIQLDESVEVRVVRSCIGLLWVWRLLRTA